MKPISVFIADDHQIFIEGLKMILMRSDRHLVEIKGEAHTGNSILNLLKDQQADFLFLDMNLPDIDGIEVLSAMKENCMQTRVIVLSMFDEAKVVRAAFKAGADAYLLKSCNAHEIYIAMDKVLQGETYMSSGLSLVNRSGRNDVLMPDGKIAMSYDDRFMKKFGLSRRELEVLRLIVKVMSNKEIAKELYISDQTVSVHRKNIMRKVGVSSTASLIKIAYEHNLF